MKNWNFKQTLTYLPSVIAIGIALGVAAHAIGFEDGLIKSVVLHTMTSFLIGSSLLFVVTNVEKCSFGQTDNSRLVILGLLFAVIGVVAAEIEVGVRAVFFDGASYRPFAGEGIYLFNAIISIILGYSMFSTLTVWSDREDRKAKDPQLSKLPVRKGDSFHLLPVESISVFEAADKYAYVYTTEGEKLMCDYSLAHLETRLPAAFARIHRSHIVNVEHIATVQPYDKKRYTVSFTSQAVPPVRSSAGYQEQVRTLIKI